MSTDASTNGALLSLEGVSKRFGPVQALEGVDFDVRAAEVRSRTGLGAESAVG